jgi:hypothetical protein
MMWVNKYVGRLFMLEPPWGLGLGVGMEAVN